MEVEKGEEVEDAEDAAESRLARKVASFGMAADRYYTSGRIDSEEHSAVAENSTLASIFDSQGAGVAFILISQCRNMRFIYPN
jgi:hypothetical protein